MIYYPFSDCNCEFYQNNSSNAYNCIFSQRGISNVNKEDLSLIVDNILDRFIGNNYNEYERDQLCDQLKKIIQEQTILLSQSKIQYQQENISFFHINSYAYPINPFYNNYVQNANYQYPILQNNQISMNSSQYSKEYIKQQADQGNIECMLKYDLMLREGDGVKVDEKKSLIYFKKAADKNNSQGMAEYALTLYRNK